MSGYDIFLSSGGLLATVNVKTVDVQQNSPLYLIGQGIPDYGAMVAQDFIWMLENFSKATPPVHPMLGQLWHDRANNRETYYDGSKFVPMVSVETGLSTQFDMLTGAQNIDFTVATTITIFTGVAGRKYFPTAIVLVPHGTISAGVGPTISVGVNTATDILASTAVTSIGTGLYGRFNAHNTSAWINGAGSISLHITAAATGGLASYDVYVYGFIL